MKLTGQIRSATSLRPTDWPANNLLRLFSRHLNHRLPSTKSQINQFLTIVRRRAKRYFVWLIDFQDLQTIHVDSLTSLRALDSTFYKIERCLSADAVRIKIE